MSSPSAHRVSFFSPQALDPRIPEDEIDFSESPDEVLEWLELGE
jgi:hypothetical protein